MAISKRPSDRSIGIASLVVGVISLGISGAMNVLPDHKTIGWMAIVVAAIILLVLIIVFFQGRSERRLPKSKLPPDPSPWLSMLLVIASILILFFSFIVAAQAKPCSATGIRAEGVHGLHIENFHSYGIDCPLDIHNSTFVFLKNIYSFFH